MMTLSMTRVCQVLTVVWRIAPSYVARGICTISSVSANLKLYVAYAWFTFDPFLKEAFNEKLPSPASHPCKQSLQIMRTDLKRSSMNPWVPACELMCC
jgi:hypothetical protein